MIDFNSNCQLPIFTLFIVWQLLHIPINTQLTYIIIQYELIDKDVLLTQYEPFVVERKKANKTFKAVGT